VNVGYDPEGTVCFLIIPVVVEFICHEQGDQQEDSQADCQTKNIDG
jgi:hypothetical protein